MDIFQAGLFKGIFDLRLDYSPCTPGVCDCMVARAADSSVEHSYNSPRKLARHDSSPALRAKPAKRYRPMNLLFDLAYSAKIPRPRTPYCRLGPGRSGRRVPENPAQPVVACPLFAGAPWIIPMQFIACRFFYPAYRFRCRFPPSLCSLCSFEVWPAWSWLWRPLSFVRTRALLPRCRRGSVWIRHGTEICEGSRSVHTVPPCCRRFANRFGLKRVTMMRSIRAFTATAVSDRSWYPADEYR